MSLIIDKIENCNNIKNGSFGFDVYKSQMDSLEFQGKKNSTEYSDIQKKYILQKNKYDSSGCSTYDIESVNCISKNKQINSLVNLIANESKFVFDDKRKVADVEAYKRKLAQLKLDYEIEQCSPVLNKIASSETKKTIDSFTVLDEARIKEQNKYEVQQRVFFTGVVLVVGLIILTAFNGKNE